MSEQIIHVVFPVTICSLYTCVLLRILAWNLTPSQPDLFYHTWNRLGIDVGEGGGGGSGDAPATSFQSSFIIVLVICGLLVSVTLLILLVLYMGWHKCLVYYFYLPSVIILAVVTPAFFRSILLTINTFVPDIYTTLLLTWNFTALGLAAIFGLYAPTPLGLQQFYLIHNSAMLALLVIHALPGWAPWLLLSFLVIWDLFAVLAPFGPLKLIINMAERVGVVEMPGLVYSTDFHDATAPDRPQTLKEEAADRVQETSGQQSTKSATVGSNKNAAASAQSDETVSDSQKSETVVKDENAIEGDEAAHKSLEHAEEENGRSDDESVGRGVDKAVESDSVEHPGISIGLGDFVFYSLLIGLTSKDRNQADFYPVLAALVTVLFGLVLTMTILMLTKRALPALPISIGLGLTMAALTSAFVAPLSNRLASQAIFV